MCRLDEAAKPQNKDINTGLKTEEPTPEEIENPPVQDAQIRDAQKQTEEVQNNLSVQENQTEDPKKDPGEVPKEVSEEAPGSVSAETDLAEDEVNTELLSLAEKVGAAEHASQKETTEENDAFDSLLEPWNEEKDGGERPEDFPQELWDLKQRIGKLRGGKLYQSVILAKELKAGNKNPLRSGRLHRLASRGIRSSKWDTVSSANKLVGSTVGIFNSIDTQGQYKSLWQGATLVSNFVSLVTTSRDLFLKFRNFAGGSKTDKFFKAIGICGDIATLLSKSCSIAKTISGYFGWKNTIPWLKETMKWLTLALNMGNQLASISTASRKVHMDRKKYSEIKTRENEMWEKQILPVIKRRDTAYEESKAEVSGEESTEESTEGMTEASSKEKESSKPAEVSGTEEGPGESMKEGLSPEEDAESLKGFRRRRKVEELLQKPDLTEDEKDILISYLAVTRRKDKLKHTMIATAGGLFAGVTGLCSSFFTGFANVGSYFPNAKSKMQGGVSVGVSVAANMSAIGGIGVKMYAGSLDKPDSRSAQIQDRLFSKLELLGEDRYGLKKIENDLVNASKEQRSERKTSAENAETLYDSTEKQFGSMEVPYKKLLDTGSEKEFREMLSAGV